MCELLGMECNVLTDIVFSFHGLSSRGGKTGHHSDGWGLALYEGRVARIFLDPFPAADSPLARFVREHPIKTLLAIAHVRKKTRGNTALANTHPFVREMWGRHFVFAHNGTIKKVKNLKLGRYTPIGNTDSEHAFCYLLAALQHDFPKDRRRRPTTRTRSRGTRRRSARSAAASTCCSATATSCSRAARPSSTTSSGRRRSRRPRSAMKTSASTSPP
jgi:predicted glutamine amidotransferase